MKKNLFYGLLLAFGAFAMTSCAVDDTTDVTPATGDKTITVTPTITRTMFDMFGHTVEWETGDSYAIFAVSADGTNLGYQPAPEKVFNKSSYQITVPANTAYLYCLYPDNGEYDEWTDLSKVEVNVKNNGYYGNGENHIMAAKAEVKNDQVSVLFKPMVSMMVLNIYDTHGNGDDVVTEVTANQFGGGVAGKLTLDFTQSNVTLNNEDASWFINVEKLSTMVGEDKDSGGKVVLFVAKGKYDYMNLEITAKNKGWKVFGFENGIDLSKDGCTVNVNLSYDKVDVEDPSGSILVYAAVREGDGWKTGSEEGYEFETTSTTDINFYFNAETSKNETVFKVESDIFWMLNDWPLFTSFGAKVEKESDSQIVKISTDVFSEDATVYFKDKNSWDWDQLYPLNVHLPAAEKEVFTFNFYDTLYKNYNYEYDGKKENSWFGGRADDYGNYGELMTTDKGDNTTRFFMLNRSSEATDYNFTSEADWLKLKKSASLYEDDIYVWEVSVGADANPSKEPRYGAVVVVSPNLSETYKTAEDFIKDASEAVKDTENVLVFYVSQDGNEEGEEKELEAFDFATDPTFGFYETLATIETLASGDEYFDQYSQYGPVYKLTYETNPSMAPSNTKQLWYTFKGCPIQNDGENFVQVNAVYGSEWLTGSKFTQFGSEMEIPGVDFDSCVVLPFNFDLDTFTDNPAVFQVMKDTYTIAFTLVVDFAYAAPEVDTDFTVTLSLVSYTDDSITIKATPSDNTTSYTFAKLSNSSQSNYGSPKKYFEQSISWGSTPTAEDEDIYTGIKELTFQSTKNFGYDTAGFYAAQVNGKNIVMSTLVEYVHTWGQEPTLGGGSGEEPGDSLPTVSDDNFTLEVVSVTSSSISIHVTPTDTAAEWFAYPVYTSSASSMGGPDGYIDAQIGWNNTGSWPYKNDSSAMSFTGEQVVKLTVDSGTSYEIAVWKGTYQKRDSNSLSVTVVSE